MATWRLKTQAEGSAETRTLMQKNGVTITMVEGYESGSVWLTTEDDELPVVDLDNASGVNTIELEDSNTEWEYHSFDNSIYCTVELTQGELSDEEIEKLQAICSQDNVYGLAQAGWEDMGEQEWWFFGPLTLEDEDEDGDLVESGSAS